MVNADKRRFFLIPATVFMAPPVASQALHL